MHVYCEYYFSSCDLKITNQPGPIDKQDVPKLKSCTVQYCYLSKVWKNKNITPTKKHLIS